MRSTDLDELTVAFQDTPAEEAVGLALKLAADPSATPKGAEKEFES